MRGSAAFRAAVAPGGVLAGPWVKNELWRRAKAVPSLDLRFADNKSLVDATTGAQLVTFTRASSGTFVGSDGVLQTAVTNVPRFDHNPTTGESLGLLVEEQRTNLLVQSEFGSIGTTAVNNAWYETFAELDTTVNSANSPNGTTTAALLSVNTNTTFRAVFHRSNIATTGTYAFTVFVKNNSTDTRARLLLSGDTGVVNFVRSDFTLSGEGSAGAAGVGGTGVSPSSPSIQRYPDGWYRCTITATLTSPTNITVLIYPGDPGAQTSSSQILVWGAQLEAGAFPTSYIPTTTATVTRSADVASITGTAFSSWYRQDEGTMFAELVPRTFANLAGVVSADDNSSNNRVALRTTTSSLANLRVGVSGVAQADFTASPTLAAGVLTKIAGGYKTDDFAISANGSAAASDTSGTSPTLANQLTIGTATGNSAVNAPIRRLTYWPTRLPNSTLQAVTQ